MTAGIEYHETAAPVGWEHIVARVWRLSGGAHPRDPEPIASDGSVEIIFHLGDQFVEDREVVRRQPRATLVGPTIRPTFVAPDGIIDTIGIRLHPWAAGTLLRIPMIEIADAILETDAILHGAGSVVERAATEATFEKKLEHVLSWLAPRREWHPPAIARNLGMMLSKVRREIPSSAWLASTTGRTTRTIERVFASEVGLGAKALGRVTRMQRALSLARTMPRATWSRVALDAGFYDQPHFNREFRELVGGAPSDYRRATDTLTHAFTDAVVR